MNRTLSPTNWIGVFISCAMPAASWPIDSSFCAWASLRLEEPPLGGVRAEQQDARGLAPAGSDRGQRDPEIALAAIDTPIGDVGEARGRVAGPGEGDAVEHGPPVPRDPLSRNGRPRTAAAGMANAASAAAFQRVTAPRSSTASGPGDGGEEVLRLRVGLAQAPRRLLGNRIRHLHLTVAPRRARCVGSPLVVLSVSARHPMSDSFSPSPIPPRGPRPCSGG